MLTVVHTRLPSPFRFRNKESYDISPTGTAKCHSHLQDYEPDYTSGSGASIGSVAGASDHDQDTGAESFHGNESIAEMISHASSGPAEEVDYAVPIDLDFFDDPDLNYIAKDFVQEAQRLNMNRTQKVGMWEYTKRHHPELSIEMKSYDTLERRVRSVMPAPKVSWKVRDIATNELSSGAGWAFPEKEYGNRDKCEVQEVWTRLSLRDLIRFHAGLHRDSCPFVIDGKIDYNLVDVTFTVDGVPYAKSSSDNLHLMALRFKGCRLVYIAQARVAKKGFPKDVNTFLDPFVEECVTLNVNVNYFIADAPMRAFLKRLKGHAGRYSCEVCEARGSCLQRRICYPSDQVSQRLRSRPRWRECLLDLESQRKQGHVDHVKGIMGASPLLRLPNQFDIVRQCPTDPMHRDWLGLMKSTLWRNTVGISKAGNVSARGQRITQFVNDHYKHVQLPQEYSHRSRAIDYANYKAHEWQSLLVTSFHKIAEIVTTEVGERLAKIWTVFAFFTFLYYGPTWVQESMDESALEDLHEQLYKDFEEEFGELACSYNWHTYHHMPLVRKFGRPSQVSTEPFESAYGHAQTSFASGTRNIGLQICRNMLLRNLSHEPRRDQCSRKLIMNTPNESVRSDDSILIDDNLKFYKIVDLRRDSVTVVRMVTRHWESVLDPTLPFHQVGVCVYDSLDDEEIVRPKTYFQGKGVLLNDGLLVPLHKELLHS